MIFKHVLILRFVFSLCIQSHLFICVFHAYTIVCSRKLTCKAKITELIRKTQQQRKKKRKKKKNKKELGLVMFPAEVQQGESTRLLQLSRFSVHPFPDLFLGLLSLSCVSAENLIIQSGLHSSPDVLCHVSKPNVVMSFMQKACQRQDSFRHKYQLMELTKSGGMLGYPWEQ